MALFSLAASHIGIAMGGSERWESDWSPFTAPKGRFGFCEGVAIESSGKLFADASIGRPKNVH